MNLLDIIILITMVFLVVRGIFRGFFMEIASLAGLILGVLLSLHFYPQMTNYLRPYLPSIDVFFIQLISIGAIFTCILVLCNLGGWGLKVLSKRTFLGWTDKGLGAGFAVLKGILITYLTLIVITFFVPSKAPLVAKSKLAPMIIHSYQTIVSSISPNSYQNWKSKFMEHKKMISNVVSEKVEDFTKKDDS